MSLNSDFQKLSVGGIVTLYELDASNLGLGIMRFHGHITRAEWHHIRQYAGSIKDWAGDIDRYAGDTFDLDSDGEEFTVKRDIIWRGDIYSPMPMRSDGLEVRGDGKASTPTLSMANIFNGVVGGLSALCLRYDDLAGAKLTVYTTLAKYLDGENFVEGNLNASSDHKKQVWYIEQKTSEQTSEMSSFLSFELSNPIDFEGQQIPCREITSFCHWGVHGRYRGAECGYRGTAMFTEDGTPTNDPAKDKCGCRLSDCKLRFGENNVLRFGGFPSSGLS